MDSIKEFLSCLPLVFSTINPESPRKVRWTKIQEALIIGVIVAMSTSYVNHKVMEATVKDIKVDMKDVKVDIEGIRQDNINRGLQIIEISTKLKGHMDFDRYRRYDGEE